jgi:predicted anti-sigma-YlaC factor YlaD
MLSCREVTGMASDHLEGVLPLRSRLGMRLHLWMCAYCRLYVRQIAQVATLLRGLGGRPTTAPALARELRDRLEQRREDAPPASPEP